MTSEAWVGPPAKIDRAPRNPWCGLLKFDKPTGLTSHDVVDRVRRRLRLESAGHLGTLDPAASGLLLIAVGVATRCALLWQGGDKTYEGRLRLGVVTSTQDMTGEILERKTVDVDTEAVRQASRALLGVTEQIPPMVSALKQGGQRLYRLARRGVVVDRAPRRIEVTEWEWLDLNPPLASFRVRCSSGTYVRTLVHDLGMRLGTGAALQSLRRLRSEPFGLENAVSLRELGELSPPDLWAQRGIVLSDALSHLPSVRLDENAALGIGYGAAARVSRHALGPEDREGRHTALSGGPRSVVLRDPTDTVLALGELKPDPEAPDYLLACPHVVFPWAVREGRR